MHDMALNFTAELWVYHTTTVSWHFLTLPKETAERVRFFRQKPSGFGTVRVKAVIGTTEWKTSLFPDKASKSFLLPIKAEVRKKEALQVGKKASVTLTLDL